MNQSIKTLKDTGTCPVCWLIFKLQKKDGILHKHGHCSPNNGPCPGSYKRSSARQTAAARPTSQQSGSNQDVHTAQTDTPSDQSQPRLTNDDQDLGLKHPPWTPFITRIPKAARSACALTLSTILGHIVANKLLLSEWESLFAFGPTVLAKSVRGGSTRNLTNAVLRNLARCSDTPSYKTVLSRQPRKLSRRRRLQCLQQLFRTRWKLGILERRFDYVAPKRQSHQALMEPMRRSKPKTRRHNQNADQRRV